MLCGVMAKRVANGVQTNQLDPFPSAYRIVCLSSFSFSSSSHSPHLSPRAHTAMLLLCALTQLRDGLVMGHHRAFPLYQVPFSLSPSIVYER